MPIGAEIIRKLELNFSRYPDLTPTHEDSHMTLPAAFAIDGHLDVVKLCAVLLGSC